MSKHRSLQLILDFLIQQGWDRAWRFTFITRSQMFLLLWRGLQEGKKPYWWAEASPFLTDAVSEAHISQHPSWGQKQSLWLQVTWAILVVHPDRLHRFSLGQFLRMSHTSSLHTPPLHSCVRKDWERLWCGQNNHWVPCLSTLLVYLCFSMSFSYFMTLKIVENYNDASDFCL